MDVIRVNFMPPVMPSTSYSISPESQSKNLKVALPTVSRSTLAGSKSGPNMPPDVSIKPSKTNWFPSAVPTATLIGPLTPSPAPSTTYVVNARDLLAEVADKQPRQIFASFPSSYLAYTP